MDSIDLSDPPMTVRLRRDVRARRFTLRLDPSGAGAVLTVPPGVPAREIRSFVARHTDWLRAAKARQPETVVVGNDMSLPVDGRLYRIDVAAGPRRPPKMVDERIILKGQDLVGPRLATWLKARARDRLAPAAHRYAGLLDRQIKRIALRDTRSRWGSCSTTGTVSFSWRLAMAPPEIQEYVAAHEAAHLVEMNHSPDYWAIVARICPDYKVKRGWLRRQGRDLHRYVFE